MYRKNDSMDSIKYCIIKRKGPPEIESPSILNFVILFSSKLGT